MRKQERNPNLFHQTLNQAWKETLEEVLGGGKPCNLLDLLAILGFGDKEVNLARNPSFLPLSLSLVDV